MNKFNKFIGQYYNIYQKFYLALALKFHNLI